MIAVVNYGVGNLFSIESSLKSLGFESLITSDKGEISAADKIILPGVGAFGNAVEKLKESGLFSVIKREAELGKPVFGICLGMQLLFEKSYEFGLFSGLGLLKGEICPLKDDIAGLKIPHMGWNSLNIVKKSPVLKYVNEGEYVYFVHSFYAKNCDNTTIATCGYGADIPAVVGEGNIFGAQFHPEKSGDTGLKILKAFGEL